MSEKQILMGIFIIVYVTACPKENPAIDYDTNSDDVSNIGVRQVDDVFYVMTNASLKLVCKINFIDIRANWKEATFKWYLNGKHYPSKVDLQMSTDGGKQYPDTSYIMIFYTHSYNPSPPFTRNELKCLLNDSIDCIKETNVFIQVVSGDGNGSDLNIDIRVPIIVIISVTAATVAAIILVLFAVTLYIKYRRRRLEQRGSNGKAGHAMKPYKPKSLQSHDEDINVTYSSSNIYDIRIRNRVKCPLSCHEMNFYLPRLTGN